MNISYPLLIFAGNSSGEVRMSFKDIELFILSGVYPDSLSTWGERSNFKRKCKNFKVDRGVLFRKSPAEGEGFKIVVQQQEEQERIIASCHAGPQGTHVLSGQHRK